MEFLASNRFWFMASGITTFLRVSGWTFSQHVSTPQVIILVHPLWSFFLIIFSVVLRACQDFRGDELWPRQRLRGTARVRGEKKGLLWHLGGCDTSWLWFPRSKPQQADRVEPDQPAEPQKAAIHWGFTWIHQVSRCFFFLNPKQLVFCDQSPKHSCRGCSSPTQHQWLWEAGPYWFKHVWKDSNTPMSQVGFHLRVFVRPPDFPTSNYYFLKA